VLVTTNLVEITRAAFDVNPLALTRVQELIQLKVVVVSLFGFECCASRVFMHE
jgi:hypothetical protein